MKKLFAALAVCITLFLPVAALAQPPLPPAKPLAFPGVLGYGAEAQCGRGGDVIYVTNLNNSGTGSLRDALEEVGPRTIVFNVSGTITLTQGIFIQNPYVTIAGQTAPGGGIQLRMAPDYAGTGSPLTIRTNDVCVFYLKVRPGPGAPAPNGGQPDCIAIASTAERHAYNIMLDHISCQWAIDKGIDIGSPYDDPDAFRSHHITIQDSIIAQNLHCATHDEGCHSKGMTLGGMNHSVSIIGNLWAANHERQPLVHAVGRTDVINNYIYNANPAGIGPPSNIKIVRDRNGLGLLAGGYLATQHINVINNKIVYTDTADFSIPGVMFVKRTPDPELDTQIYLRGNLGITRTAQTDSEWFEYAYVDATNEWSVVDQSTYLTDIPHSGPMRPIWATADLEELMLPRVGAYKRLNCDGSWVYNRDIIDTQVISGVLSNTLTLIDDPSEVGGWPDLSGGTPCTDADQDGMFDLWETNRGMNPNDYGDRNADPDGNGYTALEEFLSGVGSY